MASDMKNLRVEASNGTYEFDVVDSIARETANTAKTTADTAKSTADTAKTTADTAKSTADTAKATADAAKTAADAAKATAEGISIPAKLPNPNKLIFTGGATGEYDGSAPLTIQIPTEGSGGDGSGPIQYVESLDESNLANLRDLETGTYVLYGYFVPYPGSEDIMTCDNTLASVAHLSAGSHVLVFNPLNCKVNFLEILVDEGAAGGFTYTLSIVSLLDLVNMQASQVQTITAESTHDQIPTAKAVYDLFSSLKVADEVAY